jgi:hypothetical protein
VDTMLVEILTFEGCSNAAGTRDRDRDALRAEAVRAKVRRVEVDTPERAQERRFLCSPSVRIDGKDVEPAADGRTAYGLMCRRYCGGLSTEGPPSVAMIRAAIGRRAAKR